MRFLLDQNVPDSVARVLENHDHEVLHLRDVAAIDTVDEIVATISEQEEAILVSSDGDFKKIAPRVPDGQKRRFKRLSRISLKCSAPRASQRIEAAMSLIEAEYQLAQISRDRRMFLVISDSFIRTDR